MAAEKVDLRRLADRTRQRLTEFNDIEENPGPFKVISANLRGLTQQTFTELCYLAETKEPDVIMLQELKSAQLDLPALPGYVAYKRNRDIAPGPGQVHTGGGIATYVKISHASTIAYSAVNSEVERLEVSVTLHSGRVILFCNIYVPPWALPSFDVDELPDGDDVVLAGDVNSHHPDWSVAVQNLKGRELQMWLTRSSLKCRNDPAVPTRVVRHGGATRRSSPDIMAASRNIHVVGWELLENHNLGSDHATMQLILNLSERRPVGSNKIIWRWDKADWRRYSKEMERYASETALPPQHKEAYNRFKGREMH